MQTLGKIGNNIGGSLGNIISRKIVRFLGKQILKAMYILRLAFWKARVCKMGKVNYIGKYVVMHNPENIILGENISIADFVHIRGGGGVEIGNNTMLAARTCISSETHDKNAEIYQNSLIQKKVTIGNNVWTGIGAIILAGVTIGDGAIVGAGAVVTTDVEPNSIVLGIPAKPLKD